MQVQNIYTGEYIMYSLYFEPERMHYHIRHETPFTDRYSEWAVYIVHNGDMIYLPYGNNKCDNLYVVTLAYRLGMIECPYGIYKIPMHKFMSTPQFEPTQYSEFEAEFDEADFEEDEFDLNDFI